MKPTDASALTQYLLGVFLCDRYSRGKLSLPSVASVNFRAACYEGTGKGDEGATSTSTVSMRHVDIGFVCSVCLAVYSEQRKVCLQCGTQVYLKST
jgi:hypothetical protein